MQTLSTAHAVYTISDPSRNAKTGPIMVTTASKKTCPDACPLKRNGCYAENSHLGIMWEKLSKARKGAKSIPHGRHRIQLHDHKSLIAAILTRKPGELWRHLQAGDLPGDGDTIDAQQLDDIATANQTARAAGFGFSHKPVDRESSIGRANIGAIRAAVAKGLAVNLSADNLAEADRKAELGIAPVVTLLPADQFANTTTPAGRRVVVCPATRPDLEDKGITCKSCRLCSRINRAVIIGFPAHGAGQAKVTAVSRRGA